MILILNDVAGTEIVLILVFILIFFGAKSIPGLAKTLGKTIRQVKEASQDIQNEIKKSGAEMKKDLNLQGILEETAEDIKRPLDQMAVDLDQSIKYQPNIKDAHTKLQPELENKPKSSKLPVEDLKPTSEAKEESADKK